MLLSTILNIANLKKMVESGMIELKTHPTKNLYILDYSPAAQYSRTWNNETTTCRGLVVEGHPFEDNSKVIGRPFPKFFNINEHLADADLLGELPSSSFEVFDKADGSLGIGINYQGVTSVSTRGSFSGVQATWANEFLAENFPNFSIPKGQTYLFEIIYPENRIVVNYGNLKTLQLLAIIDNKTGADLPLPGVWPGDVVKRYDSIKDVEEITKLITESEAAGEASEGFVIKFNGPSDQPSFRSKAKYLNYVALHKIITNVSTKVIWKHLAENKPLDELLTNVPDEFYNFVQSTVEELTSKYKEIEDQILEDYNLLLQQQLPSRKEQAEFVLKNSKGSPYYVFMKLENKDYSELIWKKLKPAYEKPFHKVVE